MSADTLYLFAGPALAAPFLVWSFLNIRVHQARAVTLVDDKGWARARVLSVALDAALAELDRLGAVQAAERVRSITSAASLAFPAPLRTEKP